MQNTCALAEKGKANLFGNVYLLRILLNSQEEEEEEILQEEILKDDLNISWSQDILTDFIVTSRGCVPVENPVESRENR